MRHIFKSLLLVGVWSSVGSYYGGKVWIEVSVPLATMGWVVLLYVVSLALLGGRVQVDVSSRDTPAGDHG